MGIQDLSAGDITANNVAKYPVLTHCYVKTRATQYTIPQF